MRLGRRKRSRGISSVSLLSPLLFFPLAHALLLPLTQRINELIHYVHSMTVRSSTVNPFLL